MSYVRFAAAVVLLVVAATACSGSDDAESVALQGSAAATPSLGATRVPRVVMTPLPRRTPLAQGSPVAPLLTTPLATVTPEGTATTTATATVTSTPSTTTTPVITATPTPSPTISPTVLPTGTASGPTPTPGPSRQVQSGANTLASKVEAFREALDARDTDTMLRLQRELLDEAAKVEASIKDDTSQYAEHLRAAIRAIREGSAGETGKLDAATRELAQAMASQSGEERAQDQGTRTPAPSEAELRSMAESLERKVGSFEEALQSRNSESILRQQKELLDEMARIEQAVKSDRTKQAEQLRSALEAIKNGLAGDESKFDEARRALREALGD